MAASENRKAKSGDASATLMSIIRTLSSSSDVSKRELEKEKLEKAHRGSDKILDGLVADHQTDLTSIIQAFSRINSRITESQEKIRNIKDNLQSCKNLLHCKRDELRKLWIDGIEHKTVVSMLDQVDDVKDISDRLQQLIDKKLYLHATDLLVKSVSILEGDLSDVQALRDVKQELLSKKEELFEILMDELHKQIYIKPMSSVVKGFQRSGSQRSSQKDNKGPPYLKLAIYNAVQQSEDLTVAEQSLKHLMEIKLDDVLAPQQISEDLHVDPEQDPVQFIAVLVESLAILRKMPEAVDGLRTNRKKGLFAIVQRASMQVADNAYNENENLSQIYQPQLLLELLELVFQQFRVVARIQQIVIANMVRVKNTMTTLGDFCIYDMEEVWKQIQSVLQLLLTDYLDIRHTDTTQNAPVSFDSPDSQDVGSYFNKRRVAKPNKFPLFRFGSSSHAISLSSYMREQRQEFYGTGEILDDDSGMMTKKEFVCKPCGNNIISTYNPLKKFMTEIDEQTKGTSGSRQLQNFISQFVTRIYLDQVRANMKTSLDSATKGYDTTRAVIELRTQTELGVPKPLLESTVAVAKCLQSLHELMYSLPDHANFFVTLVSTNLSQYRDRCTEAYKRIVMPETDDKRIISAAWATDEDISRLIKSLPNWNALQEEDLPEMAEEDLRAMNSKESSILTSNLASTESQVTSDMIISDTSLLKTLANMVESLEWFSGQISNLSKSLSSESHTYSLPGKLSKNAVTPPTVSSNTVSTLQSLAKDFMAQSNMCLLVLHLEVRVHCFYYLSLAMKSNYSGAIDDMDPDPSVIRLNKDLSSVEEVLSQSLQPIKFRYIFEGLGHLVSSILINSTQYLKRINENGIKKMCRNIFAIQQSLTNITTNRESDLDHARQYYELLYLAPDDILKLLVERGPQFTLKEYQHLLTLAHKSQRGHQDGVLKERIHKLERIFTDYENMV